MYIVTPSQACKSSPLLTDAEIQVIGATDKIGFSCRITPGKPRLVDGHHCKVYATATHLYFHKLSNTTPPTIIAALTTILGVTRSTSRKKIAAKINEKNDPVLAMGITTETLPRSRA